MKKKTMGRLAAASLAVMTVASTLGMTVNADVYVGDKFTSIDKQEHYLAYGKAYVVHYDGSYQGLVQPSTVIYSTSAAADAFIRSTKKIKDNYTVDEKYLIKKSDGSTEVDYANVPLDAFKAYKEEKDIVSIVGAGKLFYHNTSDYTITTEDKSTVSGYQAFVASTDGKTIPNGSGGTPTNPGGTVSGTGYKYMNNSFYWAGNYVYYSLYTGMYYPNYTSFYYDVYNTMGGAAYTGSSYYNRYTATNRGYTNGSRYFDPYGGYYYITDPGGYAVSISGFNAAYDNYNGNGYQSDWDTYDVYMVNNRYYPTLSSAQSAANNNYYGITKVRDLSAPQTNYFSHTTGQYYNTYQAALNASGNVSSNVYTFNYYTNTNYNDPYYNYNYGSGYDPYYLYWLNKQQGGGSSSSSSDTSSAAIGKRRGWNAIAAYAKSLKSGSSTSVAMNDETTVPSSVMSAIKGKDVTLKFVLDNGATVAINGTSVESAKSLDIGVEYNSGSVPSKLVSKAKKVNDAVTSAKISIDEGSFGAEADVTVKFNKKRAGCTAKLYRYNESQNKLSLVSKAKVQSNGKVTFSEVDKGGDFVIVLS